jgi:hypothetical protein
MKNFIKKYEVYREVDFKDEQKVLIKNFMGTKSLRKILWGLKTKFENL